MFRWWVSFWIVLQGCLYVRVVVLRAMRAIAHHVVFVVQ